MLDDALYTRTTAPCDPTSSSTTPPTKSSIQQILQQSQDPTKKVPKERGRKRKQLDEKAQIEERKKFLERNRVAANRCRDRRKAYISDLEKREKKISTENQLLHCEIAMLRKEIISLKALVDVQCACSEDMMEHNLRKKLRDLEPDGTHIAESIAKLKVIRESDTVIDVSVRDTLSVSSSIVGSSNAHHDLFLTVEMRS